MSNEELEANARRTAAAAAVVRWAQGIVPAMDTASAVYGEYWDIRNELGIDQGEGRGINFVDNDLTMMDMTVEDLTAAVTLLDNFIKFLDGRSVAAGVYRVTLNKLRRVGAHI